MTSTTTFLINSNNLMAWMKSLTNNLMRTMSKTTVKDRVISLMSKRMMVVEHLESFQSQSAAVLTSREDFGQPLNEYPTTIFKSLLHLHKADGIHSY
jgi:hypothetical protein